ncbi:DUF1553 domain-containing protein [Isosphaeraceae bacterium EP7]
MRTPRDWVRPVAAWCVSSALLGGGSIVLADESSASPEAISSFEKNVRPILIEHCQACHGPKKDRGGLRVDSREALLKGGDNGPAIVPGQAGESLLITALHHAPGQELKMPPKGKLPAPILAALTNWVQQGAPWPAAKGTVVEPANEADAGVKSEGMSPGANPAEDASLWAFRPPVDVPAPPVRDTSWPSSPIDRFVIAGLEAKALTPAPPAERRALIRRATFDLTGLPPTPEEVVAFLSDDRPGAFARVVDRLLESPRYGERWGRHWLDVARYADSNGMDENVAMANAYRYRDYVIGAFNADLPYDQFIREQIAGDLAAEADGGARRVERLVATGFLSIGPKMLAEDDPQKMEMDIIDEQVDTIGRTFLGLTIGCARCHDHKFDPIPTADYYALAGIFKSTRTMANHKVVAMWNERPVPTAAQIADAAAFKSQANAKRSEAATISAASNGKVLDELRGRIADTLLAADARVARSRVVAPTTAPLAESASAGSLMVEAEAFQRGNVAKDTATYGKGIGVILNAGPVPNRAEYDLTVPTSGAYQVELRYAAEETRPVRLTLAGRTLSQEVAAKVTGGWNPEHQTWSVVAVDVLTAGPSTLVIERDGPLPHIDKIALIPVVETGPKSTDPIEAFAGLHPDAVGRWATALESSAGHPDSILSAWHELTGETNPGFIGPETSWHAALTADPRPGTKRELADRYQSVLIASSGTSAEGSPLHAFLNQPGAPAALPVDPTASYPAEIRTKLGALKIESDALDAKAAATPMALAVQDQTPTDLQIHIRGSHLTLGTKAPRGFLRVVAGDAPPSIAEGTSGRGELARWIAGPSNPLTARVMVNRLWRWHFGEGLVRTTDNFGRLGERPDHPELLDWLSLRFVEDGWSIKAMHRRIMASSAYQMSTKLDPEAVRIDPENRLLWRMSRRRLEAEAIRDALLSVGGDLDTTMGGNLLPTGNHAYVSSTASESGAGRYAMPRRSVYMPVIRSGVYDVFQAFDFADPSAPNGSRATTTVAPQALFLLNDDLILSESKALAARLFDASTCQPEDPARVRRAYELAYSRPASETEVSGAIDFLGRYETAIGPREADPAARRQRAWRGFCHALLASSEFLTID